MEHCINISGQDGNLLVTTDGEEPKVFSRDEDITAADLYDALHYHAGDTYVLEQGELGDIKEGAFNAFYKLMQDIIEGIGKISISNSSDSVAGEEESINGTTSSTNYEA